MATTRAEMKEAVRACAAETMTVFDYYAHVGEFLASGFTRADVTAVNLEVAAELGDGNLKGS